MATIVARLLQNRFLKYGAPFFTMVVGGPFILQHFTAIRYKYAAPKTPENEMELLNTFEHRMTLEDHYEEMKTMDIDTWDQVRSPRPWDEPPDHPQATEADAKKSEAKT